MTLFSIFKRYQWRIILTLILVLAEAIAMLLFPLVIGFAIDGLLTGIYTGLWQLGLLGLGVVISGSLRRFYDTRVYSNIYVDLSTETVESNQKIDSSTLNARVTMLRELVEFLENQLPELINSLIGLFGTISILYFLDMQIFLACLIVLLVITIVFMATGKLTTNLNYYYNNTMEKQVIAIENSSITPIRGFMQTLMKWNIKLSDLETIIFGVIWLVMIGLIVFSVVQAVDASEAIKAGTVMSVVMYVFEFSERAGMLPLYFQQFLRLQEISSRLVS